LNDEELCDVKEAEEALVKAKEEWIDIVEREKEIREKEY
jgi:hypothetical protein